MKKLKLKALEIGATETLSRAQLKNVFGGVQQPTTTGCVTVGNACGGTVYGSCCAGLFCHLSDEGAGYNTCYYN